VKPCYWFIQSALTKIDGNFLLNIWPFIDHTHFIAVISVLLYVH